MSDKIYEQAKKMLALEELAKLAITEARKKENKEEGNFWKRVQSEIELITEGLADDERDKV